MPRSSYLPIHRLGIPLPRRRLRRKMMTLLVLLSLTILVFVGPAYIVYKPPTWLIRLFEYRWPDVTFRLPISHTAEHAIADNANPDNAMGGVLRPIIALTIDDAPSSHTLEILQVLEEFNAHATFFVIGSQVERRESILQQIVSAGHELGNHAWRDEPSRSLPTTEIRQQIQEVDRIISNIYTTTATTTATAKPRKYKWFRPGSGVFSTRLRKVVDEAGYTLVLGNVYPHDPQIARPKVNAKHVLSMVSGGSIVIVHDRRSWTVPMLRIVLPELQRRGYVVGSLGEAFDKAERSKKGHDGVKSI